MNREHNNEVFNRFFQNVETWVDDYIESNDYADGYSYLMNEGTSINESIERILKPDYYLHYETNRHICGISENARLPKDFYDDVVERILFCNLFESRCVDEYSSTPNLWIDGFNVGEYEQQIELKEILIATRGDIETEDRETWNDCLIEYLSTQKDHCIRWEPIQHGQNYLFMYVLTGMRIDFVLTAEQLEQVTTDVIVRYCEQKDYDKSRKKT